MRSLIAGFSLVEVMLVLALSSGVMLSGFYLLQHSVQLYHQQQNTLEANNGQRYVQHILSYAVRMAGYLPCNTLQHLQAHLLPITVIQPPYPRWLKTVSRKSEVLKINFADPKLHYLSEDMQAPHSTLAITPGLALKQHRTYVLTDCEHISLFSSDQKIHTLYKKNSIITPLLTRWFYLRPSTNDDSSALFMRDETGRSEELLNHVDNFRLWFSENKQAFVKATQIHDWYKISAVKIQLETMHHHFQTFIIRLRNQ